MCCAGVYLHWTGLHRYCPSDSADDTAVSARSRFVCKRFQTVSPLVSIHRSLSEISGRLCGHPFHDKTDKDSDSGLCDRADCYWILVLSGFAKVILAAVLLFHYAYFLFGIKTIDEKADKVKNREIRVE